MLNLFFRSYEEKESWVGMAMENPKRVFGGVHALHSGFRRTWRRSPPRKEAK